MITVDFIDAKQFTSEGEREEIKSLLSLAYEFLNQENDAEVSISFVNSEEIRAINHDYRGKDAVTDVISFAIEDEADNVIHDEAIRTLGDIIICTDRAKEQAIDYGHSYRRELLFLSLHGFLHLLGYDHIDKADEVLMNEKQDEILEAFGATRED